MRTITLKGRPIVSGNVEGLALVSMKPISFLGGVDPNSGIIIEKSHDLQGKNIAKKILCFPNGHGSTVGSYVLYSLVKKGNGPKAIINQSADPVIVVGAIIADIPMVDQVDIKKIETDDEVEVDSEKGIVKVRKK